MSDRFANPRKIPDQPASRLLAAANAKLETRLKSPASAGVAEVLAELKEADSWIDMMRLLSVALPPRECVWWACLAGRNVMGKDKSPCLKAAEAWVFDPSDENREKLQVVMDNADIDDDAALCATAAFFAPGNMGLGDLSETPAPVGVVSSCCFGMNMLALERLNLTLDEAAYHLIDRALDIADGGNGSVDLRTSDPDEERSELVEGDN